MVEEIKTATHRGDLLTLSFCRFPLHFTRNYYVGGTRVVKQVLTSATLPSANQTSGNEESRMFN